jgi:dihydrofolate synthase/folylpolyglutamate synthase
VSALRTALEPLLHGQPVTGVISILDDKDAAGMLSVLMPLCDSIVFTHSSHERSLSPATLESLCRQLGGPPSEIEPSPVEALRRAREIAGSDGAVRVTGAIYLLSDLAREGVGTAAVVDHG